LNKAQSMVFKFFPDLVLPHAKCLVVLFMRSPSSTSPCFLDSNYFMLHWRKWVVCSLQGGNFSKMVQLLLRTQKYSELLDLLCYICTSYYFVWWATERERERERERVLIT
jgi:hypothetical protein